MTLFSAEKMESLIEDLATDELAALIEIVGSKTDKLAIKDGKPLFTSDEIDLIGRFQEFVENDENHVIDISHDEAVASSI